MTFRSEPLSEAPEPHQPHRPQEPHEDTAAGEPPRSARTISLRTILFGAILAAAFVIIPWAAGGAAPWNDKSGTDAADALRAVAGDQATLRVADECGEHAVACVFEGQATVIVPPRFAELTEAEMLADGHGTWTDVMRHEFMHVLQHRLGTGLSENAEFLATFDTVPEGIQAHEFYDDVRWPMELSAECMAEVRYPGYQRSYPGFCYDDQLRFARTIIERALALE